MTKKKKNGDKNLKDSGVSWTDHKIETLNKTDHLLLNVFTQPIHMSTMWCKVNFQEKITRFEFSVSFF